MQGTYKTKGSSSTATSGPRKTWGSESNPYYDEAKLHALQMLLCTRMEELLATLGVTLYKSHRFFSGACPIHGGNNPTALNLYRKGDTRPGYWKCNTRECNAKKALGGFGSTILGFVRGVLSHQQLGWTTFKGQTLEQRKAQKKFGWEQTVDWCCDFLGIKLADIHVDHEELEKLQAAAGVNVFMRKPKQEKEGIRREVIRGFLEVPATYYLERGYSAEVLDRYDVGLYPARGRELSGRVCVPVYDNDHEVAVGFTARSIFEKCEKCQRWHNPASDCPAHPKDVKLASKWHNSDGFAKEHYLYNFWFARKHISQSRVAVLCEGPGDIWRLEEAGIHVGLAMFGTHLSDQQQVILETSGASNIVVLTDSDDAGKDARQKIEERLCNLMRLHFPLLSRKDIGDCSVEQVRSEILPVLQRIKERGY